VKYLEASKHTEIRKKSEDYIKPKPPCQSPVIVFVVGLRMRLADTGIMNEGEYFSRFGKIHEIVNNKITSYACPHGRVQVLT
jgi:hypothetical protein